MKRAHKAVEESGLKYDVVICHKGANVSLVGLHSHILAARIAHRQKSYLFGQITSNSYWLLSLFFFLLIGLCACQTSRDQKNLARAQAANAESEGNADQNNQKRDLYTVLIDKRHSIKPLPPVLPLNLGAVPADWETGNREKVPALQKIGAVAPVPFSGKPGDVMWYLGSRTEENPGGINMPKAWHLTQGSPDNAAVILDKNIAIQIGDLRGGCRDRYYFSRGQGLRNDDWTKQTIGHGTFVMLLIGRCVENGSYFAGVDWHAKVAAISFGDDILTTDHLASNMAILAGGVDVAAMHFDNDLINTVKFKGYGVLNYSLSSAANNIYNLKPVFDQVAAFNASGKHVMVVAGGNYGESAEKAAPAAITGVIAVGASNKKGMRAEHSNWGTQIAVLAPGEDIGVLTGEEINGRRYKHFEGAFHSERGTSMSSALVSGCILLMQAVNPNAKMPKIAAHYLKKGAWKLSCNEYCPSKYKESASCRRACCKGNRNICTAGLLDAFASLKEALRNPLPPVALIETDTYFIELRNKQRAAHLVIYNVGGMDGDFLVEAKDPSLRVEPMRVRIPSRGAEIVTVEYRPEDGYGAPTPQLPLLSSLFIKATGYDPDQPKSDSHTVFVRVLQE
jgi:hypothetical protein